MDYNWTKAIALVLNFASNFADYIYGHISEIV